MFYSAICMTLAVFISLVHSQETVSTSTSEYELTVNITGTDPSERYRLGYGTTPENLTWVELAGGDAATYLLYPVIGLSPGVTYRVKVERSGSEIYSQDVTTNPLPPVNILVTSAGTRFLTITWETDPRSTQDGGKVLLSSNGSEVMTFEATSGKQVNATNLQPGVRYSISVITLSRGKASVESQPRPDNTVPLPPTLTSVQAVDTKTLMITWTTQVDHDDVLLTATYNDTTNEEKTQKLTCKMLFTFCVVDVLGVPGQKLLIQGYTTLGQRQSSPYSTYHSTKPETVLGLLDNSSSTSHLHLTILPPSYSYFNLYNIEVFRDNDSELVFDQNISLARDETDIFLWNLTAGTLYNFSVTTRTIWEEIDIFSTEFVTYPYSPENLQITEVTNSSVTLTRLPVTSGGLDYYQSSITPTGNTHQVTSYEVIN